MTENGFLQGPPYNLSHIYKEEILYKLANNFPADIYFFIWRSCEERNDLRFKFTLPIYFDSKFQMRTVIYLSRLGLVNPINWDGLHKGIENLVASDIKISKTGKDTFQKWIEIGFVNIIINLPHEIRRNVEAFNNYFCNNFNFSRVLEERKNNLSIIELIEYEKFYLLNGHEEHEINMYVEYQQKIIKDKLFKEVSFVSILVSCGFCQKGFIFTITPETFDKYKNSNKPFKRGCPNCKYPLFRTKFSLFLNTKNFSYERYLTEKDKEKLYDQKQKEKNEILNRFKIFISNNIFNPSLKQLEIETFKKELDTVCNEKNSDSILINEFRGCLKDFYFEKKKQIKKSLC